MDIWGICTISFLLILTFLGGMGVEKVGGPALVGEIAVGALLGPHCSGVISSKVAWLSCVQRLR